MEIASFSTEVENFLGSMEGHVSIIQSCMPLLTKKLDNINKELESIFSQAQEVKHQEEVFHICSVENRILCQKAKKVGDPIFIAVQILPKNMFCSMYNSFENYLANLYKISLSIHPKAVDTANQKYSYSDILGFGSIDDFRNEIIENEILGFTNSSLDQQISMIEKKYGVLLLEKDDDYSELLKLSLQRNIFTHNSGIVNTTFLRNCQKYGCKIEENEKIGEPLHFCTSCFFRAYELIVLLGLKIGQNLWRKLLKPEIEIADSLLVKIGYDFITNERFELAKQFLQYSRSLDTIGSELIKKILTINNALTFYLNGEKDISDRIISEFDWSDTSPKFRIALSVLSEDYKMAKDLIVKMGKYGDIDPDYYYQWPLFKKFRETNLFDEAMEAIGFNPSYCDTSYHIPIDGQNGNGHK